MAKRIIRLCYRKVIDTSAQGKWEKYVFESTYAEFLMQAQLYDRERKFNSFTELLEKVPTAEKLHFLVSAAMLGYLEQLGGLVPDILNNLGEHVFRFSDFRFEIINSDTKNKLHHQVAINFYTVPMMWLKTVEGFLLVSRPGSENTPDGILTDLVQLRPFLSIYSLKELQE